MEDAADSMGTVQRRMQQISREQCNGGCSGYHGDSAMGDAVDIMETVQWRMQHIS